VATGELKIFRTTLTPTVRGAISKLRRWFYASFYSRAEGEAKEKSKENWARLASSLVEKSNEAGISEKAGRLTLYYYVKNGVFTPVRVEIDYYELRPAGKVEVTVSS